MKYEKQLILTDDRNPNGGEDYEASRLFMVGEVMALEWNEDKGQYGDEDHYLRPAWSTDPLFADDEGRCWHHSWCWNPAEGYTATGYGSELMPFGEGVKVLVEHDVFSFPLPESEYFRLGVQDARDGRGSRVIPKAMLRSYKEGYDSVPLPAGSVKEKVRNLCQSYDETAKDRRKEIYGEALEVWRRIYHGRPGNQPQPAAFGLKDLLDPCSVCAHLEAAYEHSYDFKETRLIPSGFPEGEQVPNERLCLPCAAKRHGVTLADKPGSPAS